MKMKNDIMPPEWNEFKKALNDAITQQNNLLKLLKPLQVNMEGMK